jgi:hypothetical protein
MRISKKDMFKQVHLLALETDLSFSVEDATIEGEGRSRFNLFTVDEETGKRLKQMNYPYQFTIRELYTAIRLCRDIYHEATNKEVKEE